MAIFWRRRRDSNPRSAFNAYTISSRAPSTKLGDFSIHIQLGNESQYIIIMPAKKKSTGFPAEVKNGNQYKWKACRGPDRLKADFKDSVYEKQITMHHVSSSSGRRRNKF